MARAIWIIPGLVVCAQAAAEQGGPTPAPTPEHGALGSANALIMLDYQRMTLTTGGRFDLLGVHYLHQVHDWLHFGFGVSGPMVEGDYGGFFAVDMTLHAKQRLIGNWYGDAGFSLGGAGGGSSIANIRDLSGSGRYTKGYLGLGYAIGSHHVGAAIADVRVLDSQIEDTVLNLFYQKAVSYAIGDYADAGRRIVQGSRHREHDSILSFEVGHLEQIDPRGSYRGDVGLLSPQFSQFFTRRDYLFFAFDLGYAGLDFYNQMHGGIGRRVAVARNLNLYGQLGVGTGGWVTDTFDTGAGLLIYPKMRAEYVWAGSLGLSLSAGYFAAPTGTSENWTVGVGINRLLLAEPAGAAGGEELDLEGLRVRLLGGRLFELEFNGKRLDDLDLAILQVDYLINDHCYVPAQLAAGASDFGGYAGYVEMSVGLGVQTRPLFARRLQGFAQVLYGMNDTGVDERRDVGPLLTASLGLDCALDDRFAVTALAGRTVSINQYLHDEENRMSDYSVALGLTYRFSVPTRAGR